MPDSESASVSDADLLVSSLSPLSPPDSRSVAAASEAGVVSGAGSSSALADALVASDELICALFFTFTLRLKGVLGEFPHLFDPDLGRAKDDSRHPVPVVIYCGDEVKVMGQDEEEKKRGSTLRGVLEGNTTPANRE